MFHPGDSIGPYALVRPLGRGAFGEVGRPLCDGMQRLPHFVRAGETDMTTIPVRVDTATESGLRHLVEQDGEDVTAVAARLLARAVRDARPRVKFDTDLIRTAIAGFEDEDERLAESAAEERAALLEWEDRA